MPTNVQVPALGESVSEAVLIKWHKQDGESVAANEPICELETDKANVDVPSPAAGVITRTRQEGESVKIGDVIATVDPAGKPTAKAGNAKAAPASTKLAEKKPEPAKEPAREPAKAAAAKDRAGVSEEMRPAVRRMVEENKLDVATIKGTGPGGRVIKEDVIRHMEEPDDDESDQRARDVDPAEAKAITSTPAAPEASENGRGIKRVPMSKIRKKIAERLVSAQQTAAILTTFNEIDLHNVMDLRSRYKEKFEKTHGVSLGFMSFFARATVLALRDFPRVNARIDGNDVVYHDYVHLGIAVSTDRGLAVPVLRHVEQMSFAKIESEIKRLAAATRDGKLSLEELSGGTFTITNGGVFGSLLSTPIINPPQSGILGMHAIQKRPVVVNDQIAVRPMMYVALSYDHRLIDGRESVSFLVRLKELLEDPARLVLEI
jgi:2-oxoglutarate dehydrogenase E2 component (dihydrolipoamide succinyltransferase)